MTWNGSLDNRGFAISESGYLVGEYQAVSPSFRTHAFWCRLDPAGTGWLLQKADLVHPGFDDCFAGGVAIVGQDTIAAGTVRPVHGPVDDDWGYRWSLTTQAYVPFQAPSGGVPQCTQANWINSMGNVAGRHRLPSLGFVWDTNPNTNPLVLSPIAGYSSSVAQAINVASLAVGQSTQASGQTQATAWLPSTGAARALGWLDPNFPKAEARGVNRSNHAVGSSDMDDPNSLGRTDSRAVLWTSLTPTDLGVLTPPLSLHSASRALAISDGIPAVLAEEVVGTSWDNSTTPPSDYRGFVWDAVTGMRDLNGVITGWNGFGPNPNVTIQKATGINSLGEISAIGYDNTSGYYQAVLLTPDVTSPRLGRLQAPFVGAATTMHGLGFTPGALVTLVWDTGQGSYFSPAPCGTPMAVDPARYPSLATTTADSRGRVAFPLTVPQVDFTTMTYFQAYEGNPGCAVSTVTTEVIG